MRFSVLLAGLLALLVSAGCSSVDKYDLDLKPHHKVGQAVEGLRDEGADVVVDDPAKWVLEERIGSAWKGRATAYEALAQLLAPWGRWICVTADPRGKVCIRQIAPRPSDSAEVRDLLTKVTALQSEIARLKAAGVSIESKVEELRLLCLRLEVLVGAPSGRRDASEDELLIELAEAMARRQQTLRKYVSALEEAARGEIAP